MRCLFGPSREEIWTQLAQQVGGRFIEGGFLKSDKVVASHGEWSITLDTYTVSTGKTVVVFTRLRAPYINPDGFRFEIHRRGIFTPVAKFFGAQDVEIGIEPFDHDFVIKGTDENKVRRLFANRELRALIEAQPHIQLAVKDDEGWFGSDFPEGVDELYFSTGGVIKDLERLKQLYELFGVTLDQLCNIGSAYENQPDVQLK
jgi:hypothetical protein